MTSNTDSDLREAFKRLLDAEQKERLANDGLKNAQLIAGRNLDNARKDVQSAWNDIQEILNETGEVEPVIHANNIDYVIYRTKSKGKTVVADVDAVPEQFVRVKKEPDLMAIKEHFSQYKPENLPNWLKFEIGEGKLTWKTSKKESAA